MAGSTSESNSTSSLATSSSHTLTFGTGSQTSPTTMTAPTLPPVASSYPAAATPLFDALAAERRHVFLQPSEALPTASLAIAKDTLDALVGSVVHEQTERIKAAPKRKRGDEKVEQLKVRKVFVDGFETGQVWQQAKRIVAAALREGEEVLRELEERGEIDGFEKAEESEDEDEVVGGSGTDLSEEEGSEEVSGEEDEEEDEEDEEEEEDEDMEGAEDSDNFDIEQEDWDEEENVDGLEGEELEEGEDDDDEDEDDQPAAEFVADPNGLNDGFFSIDEFNKQSQYFEEQDARANPNTDVASDDEELDWHADPMSAPKGQGKTSKSSNKSSSKDEEMPDLDDEGDDDEEEEGPTFGDMDLDAPEGASDDEDAGNLEDGLDGGVDLTANDVFYKDFFAPPARKAKTGNQRKGGDYVPKARRAAKPEEADVERAMNNVHRDLFDDLSDHSDSDDALSDVSAGDPKSRRSAHERRQAKLAEEIRKLEAEAVAKRDWTLSGEATGTERPINSLLEQDLAFEHVGKPVPIITEEVSESIESLIKRRILAQEFDELVRRRPGAEDAASTQRRGMIELDDSKAKQSLAEIYEEEHVKDANPDTYVSKEDEKLRKEEKEVESLWRDVCARLDALSSWHYKPKPSQPSLSVVADVATIAMEDAQPATAQGVMGGESALAPQEVYQPGKETAETGEVVAGGLPVARQEMSREDKLRRRRREKERIRKSGGDGKNGDKGNVSKKSLEKKETMDQLKKGGVRVINRKGEVVDVDGNKAKAQKAATSGSFKL